MELVIKTDLDSFPKLIEFNYPELKGVLENSLMKYQGLVYGEDEIKNAKADRAALNKLKAAIDAERKRMKAVCFAPFEDFERKTKELIAMIDRPVLEIDAQIKKFDETKRAYRKTQLSNFYLGIAQDIVDMVPFDRIYQDKWTNSSVSPKAIEAVITNTVNQIRKELETIKGFGGEMALQCTDVYLKTLNLSDALNEKTRMEELRAKVEKQDVPEQKPEETLQCHSPSRGEPGYREPVQDAETYSLEFRVIATAAQLSALKAFLKENHIHYERV